MLGMSGTVSPPAPVPWGHNGGGGAGFGVLALPQQELPRGSLSLGCREGDLADAGSDLQRWDQENSLLEEGE